MAALCCYFGAFPIRIRASKCKAFEIQFRRRNQLQRGVTLPKFIDKLACITDHNQADVGSCQIRCGICLRLLRGHGADHLYNAFDLIDGHVQLNELTQPIRETFAGFQTAREFADTLFVCADATIDPPEISALNLLKAP